MFPNIRFRSRRIAIPCFLFYCGLFVTTIDTLDARYVLYELCVQQLCIRVFLLRSTIAQLSNALRSVVFQNVSCCFVSKDKGELIVIVVVAAVVAVVVTLVVAAVVVVIVIT